MATFIFRKRKLDEIRVNIETIPGAKVWFQPTHHGGCIQVFKDEDNFKNVFCNSRTGYKAFCLHTILIQDCIELNEEWIKLLVEAKRVKFIAKYVSGRNQVRIIMKSMALD